MTTSHSFSAMLKEEVTPLDLGEGSLDLSSNKEAGLNPEDFGMSFSEDTTVQTVQTNRIPALTPIMDKVDGFRSIDWQQVMQQMKAGVNNVGVVIAVISEKTHQLGCYLANV
jgi:hypothetical protein